MTKRGKRNQPVHDAVAESSAFMREVDDALHVERMTEIWRKYRTAFFLSLAVLFLGVAVKEYIAQSKVEALEAEANTYSSYEQSKKQGTPDTTLLSELAENGHGGFKMLAQFQTAQQLSKEGKATEVEAIYKSIAQDGSLPTVQRDLARFYLAQIYMSNDVDQAKTMLKSLADEKSAYRFSAVEMLALIAESEGDTETAAQHYEFLLSDLMVLPKSLQKRAQSRLNVLRRPS